MTAKSRGCGTRPAFTLPELMVAVVVACMIVGVVAGLLGAQLRVFRWGAATMASRAQLRDAGAIMAADLRGVSVRGDTLRLLADSAVELFATIGTSVTCDASVGAQIALPPLREGGNGTLTGWHVQPDSGDLAVLYVEDSMTVAPRWDRHRIASVVGRASASACAGSNALAYGADAAAPAYVVTLRAAPPRSVPAGTPVRFVRRVRYSLYRASDTKWYLGYRRCDASGPGCSTVQPVSGPYRAYAPDGGGLSMRYFDSTGAELRGYVPPLAVARIAVTLRTDAERRAGALGPSSVGMDSSVVIVSLRNRS